MMRPVSLSLWRGRARGANVGRVPRDCRGARRRGCAGCARTSRSTDVSAAPTIDCAPIDEFDVRVVSGVRG